MNIFIRIAIALIVVVCLFAIIGPVLSLLGIPNASTLVFILKVCIGGAAAVWILNRAPFW